MKGAFFVFVLLLSLAPSSHASDPAPGANTPIKIKPKAQSPGGSALIEPDVDLIDAPTSAVLDYGGYSTLSRFFSSGGFLEEVSFGVFNRLNIGASLNVDRLIGSERPTRVRPPNVQVKYRFYEGERWLPSLAVGFDGQGYDYNQPARLYNNRQRGFYLVGSEELGLPGLMLHPSFNISDFNSNQIFGSIPLSYNIRDRVSLMLEWDNINGFANSRLNTGARFYITPGLHLDFAVRRLGQGGSYTDGAPRGAERVLQIKYTGNF